VLSYAQRDGGKNKGQMLEQRKIAYISSALDLSSEQAQQFWPIYNDYAKQRTAANKDLKKGKEDLSTLSDSEAGILIEQILDKEEKMLKLKREHIGKLRNVLDNQQIISLLNVERKFRKDILDQYKNRRKYRIKGEKGKRKEQEKEKGQG